MVRKGFSYQGKSLEELQKLSLSELAELLPSESRRKIKKLTDKEKQFLEKVKISKKPAKTHLRDMIILPFMVGKNIMVHDGKGFQQIFIVEEMIGHRLGEFALTRKRITHSAPGIGATRSSASLSVK
ncbi:30S ribosomal protein S19 [Candidatus Woesearchaeota archaeon]|nr:30S ribosomal protein S19 [Candidatus Woesearchaeota archaeon]